MSSRFVDAADGTRIAYRVAGEGPTIVLANGVTTSDFFWHHLMPRFTANHRVVSFDYKGHGKSAPARTDEGTTIPSLTDDMRRVMDEVGVERAAFIGFSMGCQVILEAWRQMPERVGALGLVLGPAGRLFDTALQPGAGPAVRQLLQRTPSRLLPSVFGVARRVTKLPGTFTVGKLLRFYGRSTGTDISRFLEHFRTIDPQTVAKVALAGGMHDARDVLPTIRVPSLVVTGDRDIFAPPRTVGLPMRAAIPGARMLRITDGTHASLFEHPELIGGALDQMLAEADF